LRLDPFGETDDDLGASVSEAAIAAANEKDKAREVACEVAQTVLRRSLRDDLGLIYSVSVSYDEDNADLPPRVRIPSVSVEFTCAPLEARRCVAATLDALWKLADEGPDEADVEAVAEQQLREKQQAAQTNDFYADALENALSSARFCSPAGVAARAAAVDEKRLISLVAEATTVQRETPSTAAIGEAVRECFPRHSRFVVTLLPERSAAEKRRRAAAIAACAAAAVATLLVAIRARRLR